MFSFSVHKLPFLAVLVLHIVLIVCSVVSGRYPETSGNAEDLFPATSPSLTALRQAQNSFGSNLYESIVIPADQGDEFLFDEIEAELKGFHGVEEVINPGMADRNDLVNGFLVRTTAGVRFLIKIKNGLTYVQKRELHQQIDNLIKRHELLSLYRNGSFFITQSLTSAIERETLKLVPLCGLLLFLLAAILFKSLWIPMIVLSAPVLTLLTVTLTAALIELPLGPVSQLAPPFIICIGTAYSIHLAHYVLKHRCLSSDVVKAILFASLTTSTGLFSLIFLDVKGVTEFAWLAGSGNLLATCYSIIVTVAFQQKLATYSAAAIVVPVPIRATQKWIASFLAFFTLCSLVGLFSLSVDTDPETFLVQNGRALSSIQSARTIFPGSRFLSLVITKDQNVPLTDPELKALDDLLPFFTAQAHVYSVISPATALRKRERVQALELGQFSLNEQESLSALTDFLITNESRVARFIVETDLDGKALLSMIDSISEKIGPRMPSLRFAWSGFEIVMAHQAQHITIGILQSIACTLVVIFLLLCFFTRSLAVSLIGLIPNIIPLVTVFGTIGYTFQEISLGAALVASAALGIAVDNTFHFIFHWLTHQRKTDIVLQKLIEPFVYTTIILAIGFSSLLFARVAPTFQFGFLLVITLIVGLMADTTVLPLLLQRWNRSRS